MGRPRDRGRCTSRSDGHAVAAAHEPYADGARRQIDADLATALGQQPIVGLLTGVGHHVQVWPMRSVWRESSAPAASRKTGLHQ